MVASYFIATSLYPASGLTPYDRGLAAQIADRGGLGGPNMSYYFVYIVYG
jgi:hypothetical protein